MYFVDLFYNSGMVRLLGGARCVTAYVPDTMVYGPFHISAILGCCTHHMGPASLGRYNIQCTCVYM